MKVDRYLKHVPEIEETIRRMKPDAIVFGMGPTAWVLPWIDQRLLQGVELWTCHDGCRIMPADHVVLMDAPIKTLGPATARYETIVNMRPRKIWVCHSHGHSAWEAIRHGKKWPMWKLHLNEAVLGIVELVKFRVWNPNMNPSMVKAKLGMEHEGVSTPDTICVSPTGTATLAWAQGRRRIGLIGVDMMIGHHHTCERVPQVDTFLCRVANQAHELGGAIFNLSPVTSLEKFKSWKPPTSTSEPTDGSETPEPKLSSSSASESTQAAQ